MFKLNASNLVPFEGYHEKNHSFNSLHLVLKTPGFR